MGAHPVVQSLRWVGIVSLCVAFAGPAAGSGKAARMSHAQGDDRAPLAKPTAAHESAAKADVALPQGVGQDWWSKVQEQIRREEYEITWTEDPPLPGMKGAWQAPNRAQGFEAYFTETGVRLTRQGGESPSWDWGLELARWGREGAWVEATAAKPHAVGNRVDLDRQGIQEWYVNNERGLEQGFTIPAPPELKLSAFSSQLSAQV